MLIAFARGMHWTCASRFVVLVFGVSIGACGNSGGNGGGSAGSSNPGTGGTSTGGTSTGGTSTGGTSTGGTSTGGTSTGGTGSIECGTITCGPTQFCVIPCCGGTAPGCVAKLDGGACPAGSDPGCLYDVTNICPNRAECCQLRPCTPPPPYCADTRPEFGCTLPTGRTCQMNCQ